jgi:D-glycero-alpha-D-manno-heptose-7-phosphate kinase
MIIVQTPLRLSLFGGGTDFREFVREEEGCVLTSAIDKYIFVIIKERFDDLIRVGWTRTEMVASVDEVQHELVREALRKVGILRGVEISTMADIPSAGSGLGSSSTVTVGLLNAMHQYRGQQVSEERLAQEACEIEIDVLGKPIGMQDQYIAAYGGLRFIRFCPDGQVKLEHLWLSEQDKSRLSEHILLYYTGVQRRSADVLGEQQANINDRRGELRAIRDLAWEARRCLDARDFAGLGELLHRSWQLKKQLASKVSNGAIDSLYDRARAAGALGGKITGAGGGGFLLIYCRPEHREAVRTALADVRELPVRLERDGSKVIFNVRR